VPYAPAARRGLASALLEAGFFMKKQSMMALAKNRFYADNKPMELQTLATNMAQSRIQEEAAVAVASMAIQSARETSEDLSRVMNSPQAITDPARGNFLDVLM